MTKKYEFTGETKTHLGIKLHRIRALVAIAAIGVAVGDLGGWIESERCLSHDGDAWVSGNAWATRNPKVLTGFKHTLTITDHHIRAGCEQHPPSVWADRGAAIIRADGVNSADAKAQAEIINMIAAKHGCIDREVA